MSTVPDSGSPSEVPAEDREIVRLLKSPEQADYEAGAALLLATYGSRAVHALRRQYPFLFPQQEDDIWSCVYEAVLKVRRWIKRFEFGKGSLGGWFLLIAHRTLLDELRSHPGQSERNRRSWWHELPTDYEPPAPPAEEPGTEADELVDRLDRAISVLAELQQAIIRADLLAGERAEDEFLAKRYNSSVNSIRVSRRKAHENIRKWFQNHPPNDNSTASDANDAND